MKWIAKKTLRINSKKLLCGIFNLRNYVNHLWKPKKALKKFGQNEDRDRERERETELVENEFRSYANSNGLYR